MHIRQDFLICSVKLLREQTAVQPGFLLPQKHVDIFFLGSGGPVSISPPNESSHHHNALAGVADHPYT